MVLSGSKRPRHTPDIDLPLSKHSCNVPTTPQVTPTREKWSLIPLPSAVVNPESQTNDTPSPQLKVSLKPYVTVYYNVCAKSMCCTVDVNTKFTFRIRTTVVVLYAIHSSL